VLWVENYHLETSFLKEASGKGCLEKVVGKISLQLSWLQIITYEFKVTCGFAKVYEIPVCRVGGRGGTHCWENFLALIPGGEDIFSP